VNNSDGDILEAGSHHRRPIVIAILCACAVILVVLAWDRPQHKDNQATRKLSQVHAVFFSFGAGGSELLLTETLTNEGADPIEILALGGDLPGLELVHVNVLGDTTSGEGPRPDTLSAPVTIDAHESESFVFEYRVTDCAAAKSGSAAIPIRARANGQEVGRVLRDESGATLASLIDQAQSETCSPDK
jgi:hypothetical protein